MFGAFVFMTGCATAFLVAFIFSMDYDGRVHPRTRNLYFERTVIPAMAYMLFTGAAVMGGSAGSLYYRLAVGTYRPKPVNTNAWFVLAAVFFCFLIQIAMLYRQARQRQNLAESKPADGWVLPVMYSLVFLFFAKLCREMMSAIIWAMFLIPFVCDTVLINVMSHWKARGELAWPTAKRFQFSLGFLLLAVWGIAAWIAGLMMFFN